LETTDTPDQNTVGGPARDPATDADLIGSRIHRARVEAGLSVLEVGRLTGISKTVLHGYERGRTKPGAREIRLLSTALKISPNRLVLGNDLFETDRPTFTSVYRKVKARPVLSQMLLFSYASLVTPFFDEPELESILTLIHAVIQARDPHSAQVMTITAEELAEAFDNVTLPDGSMTIDPVSAMQTLTAQVQERVADRVSKLPVRHD
jgi:transcriptional regulator with XRE-family HTH domain